MKKQRKLLFKRGLAVFLVLTMCVGMLQMTAFAAEAGDDSDVTVVTPDDDNRTTSNNSEPAAQDEGQDDDSSEPEETLPKDVDRIETPSDHPTAEPDGDNATWESDVKDSEGNTVGTAAGSESNTVDSTVNNPDGTKQSESGTVEDEEHSGPIEVEVPKPVVPDDNETATTKPGDSNIADGEGVETDEESGDQHIKVDVELKPDSDGNISGSNTVEFEVDTKEEKEKKLAELNDKLDSEKPETGRVDNEKGYVDTQWTKESLKDNEGNECGYQTVETKTEYTKEEGLPAPLEIPESDDSTTVTSTTDAEGNVTGYVAVTTTTLPDGTTVTETKTVTNGTMTIEKTTVTKTTTNHVVSVKKGENDKTGSASVDITVIEGEGHGQIKTEGLKPNMGNDPADNTVDHTKDFYGWVDKINTILRNPNDTSVDGELYQMKNGQTIYAFNNGANGVFDHLKEGGLMYVDGNNTLVRDGVTYAAIGENKWGTKLYVKLDEVTKLKAEEGKYLYYGENGLSSALGVGITGGNESTYNAHQLVLVDSDGNKHYVYCADLSVHPQNGDYSIGNVEDAEYLKNHPEYAEQIKAIAANGYWGTESGTGSLDAFKGWLKDIGYTKNGGYISEGVAMAVTQAAIWHYGNSGNLALTGGFTEYYYSKYGDGALGWDKAQIEVADELYQYIISHGEKVLEHANYTPTDFDDFINADSIKTPSVTVTKTESVTDDSGETRTTNTADISFVLDVEPATITKDMKVTIKDLDGNEYGTFQLDKTSGLDKLIHRDERTYTIKGVQLPNGVTLTLSLTGSQVVSKGAYLITAVEGYENSQTFVSVEEGKRTYALDVSLNLSVQEATATVTTSHDTDITRTEQIDQFWNSMWESSYTYTPPEDPGDDDDGGDDDVPPPPPEDPGDDDDDDDDDTPTTPPTTTTTTPPTEVNVPAEPTPLAEVPAEPTPLAEVPEEATPLAEIPEELEEIPEEEVPLADVPATGDISAMWYVMTILAACGLLFMHVLDGKKRRDGES